MGRSSLIGFRVVDVPEVERGSLLVLSADQWWDRFRETKGLSNRWILSMAVIYGALMVINLGNPIQFLGYTLVFSISVLLYLSNDVGWGARLRSRMAVAPGVYENGLQLSPWGEFITFWEMDSFERGRWLFKDTLLIRWRFGPKTWRIPFGFLGAEGVFEVKKRLAGRENVPRAPKLVLYGQSHV